MKKIWTDKDKEKLIALYPEVPMRGLVALLGKKPEQIKNAASRLRLQKKGRLYSWHYQDELKLIELYPNMSNAELAELLGKTESAVMGAAFKLRLFKTEEFHRTRSAKGHFPKGHEPFNKGQKMEEWAAPEAIERMAATRFKKGLVPHNTREDGEISIRTDAKSGRPYFYQRVALGKWELLARLVWKEHHGQIPDGHCIWHIDGDSLNCDIANLELITRGENARRNAKHDELPDTRVAAYLAGKRSKHLKEDFKKFPELLELKRTQIFLKRAIKKQSGDVS